MKYKITIEIEAENMREASAKTWDMIGGTSGVEYAIVRVDNKNEEEEMAK